VTGRQYDRLAWEGYADGVTGAGTAGSHAARRSPLLRCAFQVNPFDYFARHGRTPLAADEATYNDAIVQACLAEGGAPTSVALALMTGGVSVSSACSSDWTSRRI
jgi:hypothetical protein